MSLGAVSGQERQYYKFETTISYLMVYYPDSNDRSDKREELMQLLLNDSLSIFQSKLIGERDAAIHLAGFKGMMMEYPPELHDKSEPKSKIRYSIYKFKDHILTQDNYTYSYNTPYNLRFYKESRHMDWEIKEDTMRIGNHFCQRAITKYGGRVWHAWFTTDIPISDGPYKFNGLPGLIIKIHTPEHYWEFNLVSITHATNFRSLPDSDEVKNKLIKKNTFFSAKKNYIKNATVIDLMNRQIAIFDNDIKNKEIKKDEERARKDNNWIELYP